MMRSMYAGVSGLKGHQTKMDVIGNNISNINTTGFKGSRTTFQDMLSQTIQGSSSSQDGGMGGTNPVQVGLGTQVGSIDKNMSQGNLQSTGKNTDLAVEGEGFFVVSDGNVSEGSQKLYTRAGNLSFDEKGYLVNSANGYKIQGTTVGDDGNIEDPKAGNINSISFQNENIEVKDGEPTTEVGFGGNLNANLDANATDDAEKTQNISFSVYDSLGNEHSVQLNFIKSSNPDNDWNVEVGSVSGTTSTNFADPTISFNDDGSFDDTGTTEADLEFETDNGAETPQEITIDFTQLKQFASETTVTAEEVDGYPKGDMQDFSIDESGTITGVYSNGENKDIAKIALSQFRNPNGLTKEGDSLFKASNNSGSGDIGSAGTKGKGSISAGNLEMSNVDLSRQFTEMITSQRGFQANSKTITTSDQMLQELVNLKR